MKRLFTLIVLTTAALWASAQSYAPAVSYSLSAAPRAVYAGDINADGVHDVVVSFGAKGQGLPEVAVLMGIGDGTFQAPKYYQLAGIPYSMKVADFTGDGRDDVLVSFDKPREVQLLRGGVDGLSPAITIIKDVSSGFGSLAVGDVNGDGLEDFVVASSDGRSTRLLRGKGNGSFEDLGEIGSGMDADGAVVDLDGDGSVDLVLPERSKDGCSIAVNVLSGRGDGSFLPAVMRASVNGVIGISISAVPGGGTPLVVFGESGIAPPGCGANTESGFGALIQRGTRTILKTAVAPTGASGLVLADVNGDGLPDVLMLGSGASAELRVFTNLADQEGGYLGPSSFSVGASNSQLSSMVVGDFRGFGGSDLVIADSGAKRLLVLLNKSAVDVAIRVKRATKANNIWTVVGSVQSKGKNAPLPSGTMIFADGAKTLGTAVLDGLGVGSVQLEAIDKNTIHTLTAVYGGDANHQTGHKRIIVPSLPGPCFPPIDPSNCVGDPTQTPTTTSIGAGGTPNPSVYGQAVSFTVHVAPSPGPTGTIYIYDGPFANNLIVGTGTLDASSNATVVVTSLAAGTHAMYGRYSGDTNYAASTTGPVSQIVNRASTTATPAASPSTVVVGEVATVSVAVAAVAPGSGTPMGNAATTDNGATLGSVALSGGTANWSVSYPSPGVHSYASSYAGDANFLASNSSTSATVTVNKGQTTTTVSSSPNPTVSGQSVTFTASISVVAPAAGTPTGSVNFLDNGVVIGSGAVAGGSATFTSSLTAGIHTITATYTGDGNFLSSTSAAGTQTVDKAASSIALSAAPNPSVNGQTVNLSVTVTASSPGSGTPTGSVTVFDNGNSIGTITLSAGAGTLSTSFSSGSHSLTAGYNGDADFLASTTSSSIAQSVNKSPTLTTLSGSPNPSVSGQAVTLSVSVAPSGGGTGTPSGTVALLDNGSPIGTVSLTGGAGVLTTNTLAVGSHSITANYSGDSNFLVSSASTPLAQTVNKSPTSTALSGTPNPSVSGQAVMLTVTIAPQAGGAGTPTGTVDIFDNAVALSTITLSSGTGTLAISSLSVGSHSITATYNGDTNFLSSSTASALSQTVNKSPSATTVSGTPNPSVAGQPVTLTATVVAASGGSGIPSGQVTFLDGGSAIGSAALDASGNANLSISSLSVATHSIAATYGGDAKFIGSSSSTALSLAVGKSPTATSVTGTPNPSVNGQAITLTANVVASGGGSGIPTGSVVFSDGGTTLATSNLNSSATATAIVRLGTGTHSITATYGGDAKFFGSASSAALSQVVNPSPTVTSVAATPNPSVFGNNVTLTAIVSASGGGSGIPTGSVDFSDGGSLIGSGTVNGSGVASLIVNTLAVATHSITATYNGDANFLASNSSNGVSLVIDPIGTGVGLGGSGSTPDFTIVTNQSSGTIQAGQSWQTTIAVNPLQGFASQVKLLCVSLPAEASCSFTPDTVLPNGAVATATLTIATAAPKTSARLFGYSSMWAFVPFSGLGLAGLVVGAGGRRRRLFTLLTVLALLVSILGVVGCGGHDKTMFKTQPLPGTPTGTFVVPIAGSSPSGTHVTQVTLTIK